MNHRGNLYQKLIIIAQKALEESGEIPSSAEELAQISGIDVTGIKNAFPSREDMREGLLYQATVLLDDALRAGVTEAATSDPAMQMLAIGRSYLNWAENNPALFRLLVTALNGEIKPDSILHRFSIAMRDLYQRKLTEMKRLGILPPDTDIELAMLTLHCLVKGGNMLFLTRHTDPWYEDERRSTAEIAEQIFVQFLKDLTARGNAASVRSALAG